MKAHPVSIRAGMLLGAGLLSGTASAHAVDDALYPLTDALLQGKVSLDVRYRFEMVDQDRPASILDKAHAQTVRTRLGWRTGLFHGFFAYGEAENVSVVGDEDYNNTYNGKTHYPVVADPSGTEVNQAYLGYLGLKGNTFRYGRQVIFFDNHRFIGDVGWRQNQQTFDGFFYENKMLPGVTGSYAYIYDVNRVFGEDTPNKDFATAGDLHLKGHLLNMQWKPNSVTTLAAYAYLLDFDDFATESTATYGLRAVGEIPLPSLKLPALPGAPGSAILYTAEYARQSDYADNPGSFDLDYGLLEGGMRLFGVNFKAAYELLEGGAMNGTRALQTPLATLHAFNGWADQFLRTPAAGLKDTYVTVGGPVPGLAVDWLVRYDSYKSDVGSNDYGDEWGVMLSKTFAEKYTIGLEYADYSTDAPAYIAGRPDTSDVRKAWVWLQVKI
jgi:hypothetical protein